MCKQSMVLPGRLFCGIDVSAVSLAVAVQREEQLIEEREFPNNASGHKLLITWLRKRKTAVRVTLEATGIYSFDLSVALHATDGIELAVLNPKVANRFAQTLRRSKTDSADAQVLAEYSRRMPFTAWCSPNHNELQLRTICRHVESLTVQHARDQKRLYAAQGSISTPRRVIQDLKHALAAGERRIHKLRREAMTLVRSDENIRHPCPQRRRRSITLAASLDLATMMRPPLVSFLDEAEGDVSEQRRDHATLRSSFVCR